MFNILYHWGYELADLGDWLSRPTGNQGVLNGHPHALDSRLRVPGEFGQQLDE